MKINESGKVKEMKKKTTTKALRQTVRENGIVWT